MTDPELYTLIQGDATAKAFADVGNDAACATRCRAIAPPLQGPISAQQLLIWGASTGVRAWLESKLTDQTLGSLCLAIRDLLQFGGSYDSGLPANQTMLAALVDAGGVTQPQAGALMALGQYPQSITADDISRVMLPHRPEGRIGG